MENFLKKQTFSYILKIRNLEKLGDSESFRPYMFFGIFWVFLGFFGRGPWGPYGLDWILFDSFVISPVIPSSFCSVKVKKRFYLQLPLSFGGQLTKLSQLRTWKIFLKNNFFLIHPTPDLVYPHLVNTRVYWMLRPGPNFMSFISLLIKSAFSKPGFNGNSDLINQVFGP